MSRRFESNPYYSPEKCGLEQVFFVEREPDYDFNMAVVWRDVESGKYYFGADSGCSCPSPFEDVHYLSDLTEVNADNMYSIEEAVNSIYSLGDRERSSFLSSVRKLV